MEKKSLNKNLHNAKDAKKDEFYTQFADIEKELRHYKDHFKDKTVSCNCDDPRILDYDGAMGVPITFLDKYNPEQFEIIKFRKGDDDRDLVINGKSPYFRIIIRNKRV